MLVRDSSDIHANHPSAPGDALPHEELPDVRWEGVSEDALTSPEAVVLVSAHPADAAVSPAPSVAALPLLVL